MPQILIVDRGAFMAYASVTLKRSQADTMARSMGDFFGKLLHPNKAIRGHRIKALGRRTEATLEAGRGGYASSYYQEKPEYSRSDMLRNLRKLGDLLIRDGRDDEAKTAYNKLLIELIVTGRSEWGDNDILTKRPKVEEKDPAWAREMKICRLYPDHYSRKANWLMLKLDFAGAREVRRRQEAEYKDIYYQRTFPPDKWTMKRELYIGRAFLHQKKEMGELNLVTATTMDCWLTEMMAYNRNSQIWAMGKIENVAIRRAELAHKAAHAFWEKEPEWEPGNQP